MLVLITGGGGFIGSHLVESQLAHGRRVRTIDLQVERLAHLAGRPGLEIVRGDISKTDLLSSLLAGAEVVYHLASAHLGVNVPEATYQRVNVDATVGLLKAAYAAGARRVVHCSSVGVIGDVQNPPADESSECRPTNVYEKTKWAGEKAALSYAAVTGLAVTVVRPAWVYGPRCPRTEKLFHAVGQGRFVMFGDGQTLRHPIYVSDAVRGLELCAEADKAAGQIYILAGEKPVTLEELVGMIADLLGVRPPTLRLPVSLGIVAGHTLQLVFKIVGRQPPFSRRSVDFYLKNNAYDISKARRELGFQPRVDLHAGLAKTKLWLSEKQDG